MVVLGALGSGLGAGMSALGAVGSTIGSAVASAAAPVAGSILQKVITFLVFVILLSLVVFVYVVVNHLPPRSWKLSHVGENTAAEIMDMTYSMVLRLEDEYGDEIKAWLEEERAQDTTVFRFILKEWHIRADESYITRTFIVANSATPDECVSAIGPVCDENSGNRAVKCERPHVSDGDEVLQMYKDQDVAAKDFTDDVFDECPRPGKAPCYLVRDPSRRRAGDLFFGTPRPLDIHSLRDDFEVWFNLKDNDPVKPIMDCDFAMLKSIENVELFIAALPHFMRHVRDRYAVFGYCTPSEIVESKRIIDEGDADPCNRTLFLRKYHVFRATPDARADLGRRLERSDKVIDDTENDLFEAVTEDPDLVRAVIRRVDVSKGVEIDDRAGFKAVVLGELEGRFREGHELYTAHKCLRLLGQARVDMAAAKDAARSGTMRAAKDHLSDACLDFSNAIDSLVLLKETTDAKLNLVSFASFPTLERRKAAWDDISDLLNYDEDDIEAAYRAVETIDERDVLRDCSESGDQTSILERDYKRFMNLVHAVVYTGTYVAESKKYANIYHLNAEVAKRFYEIVYNDLRCAYVNKFTFKPHVSETGLVYNVQSAIEFAFTYWKWEERWDYLKELLQSAIDTTSDACGF